MNDPRHPLTAEVQQQIVTLVRAGGFPHVAAAAAGVPVKVFETWLRCGRAKRPQPLYRDFLEQIEQAQAQARLVAETKALHKAPLSWLRYGPGRQTGRLPGWTDAVKPPKVERHAFAASIQRTQELCSVMLEALEPFPEARAALAQALDPIEWLKEQQEMNPEAPLSVDDTAPETEPEAPARADPDEASAPQFDAPPEEPSAVPEAAINPQTGGNEAATNPQTSGNEAATKVQPTDNESATKPQPNGDEKAASGPAAKPQTSSGPRKKKFDINLGLPASAWTRIFL